MLLDRVDRTIKEHQLISQNDKVIVGVSGGPDSVCLLHILRRLKKKYDLDLIVAHVNYGYRGEEADKDEKYVRELAKNLQLPCLVKKLSQRAKTGKNRAVLSHS